MKQLIVTLALAASMLTAAGAATATADPGSNVCQRLRHAIATGTPIAALPPALLRRCFGPGSNVCHRLRQAIATGTPISTLPPRLLRRCFGHDDPDRPETGVTPAPPVPVSPMPAATIQGR